MMLAPTTSAISKGRARRKRAPIRALTGISVTLLTIQISFLLRAACVCRLHKCFAACGSVTRCWECLPRLCGRREARTPDRTMAQGTLDRELQPGRLCLCHRAADAKPAPVAPDASDQENRQVHLTVITKETVRLLLQLKQAAARRLIK